jgi:hypothetical protein
MTDRGCFNYRWPFNEYSLFLNEEDREDLEDTEDQKHEDHDVVKPKIAGTCVMFSFVKDEILYQVIRVEEEGSQDSVPCSPFPPESQIALTIGGPLWFQSFTSSDRLNGQPLNPDGDVRDVSSSNCLRILDTLHAIGMEARVYQLSPESPDEPYKLLNLIESALEVDNGAKFGETYIYQVPAYNAFGRLPSKQEGQGTTFLAAIRLREASKLRDWLENKSRNGLKKGGLEKGWPGEIVPEIKLRDWLKKGRLEKDWPGIKLEDWVKKGKLDKDWPRIKLKDWLEKGKLEKDWPGGVCPEESWPEESWPEESWPEESWPNPPTSKEIYDYVGVSPSSPRATGAMWETAFLERERKTDSPSELAEVRLIGRCLEKILQVDLVPEANCPEREALVSNIFHWPNVDLMAML